MDLGKIKLEEEKISAFLGQKIFLPQPNISEQDLEKFKQFNFDLHFLPQIQLAENHKFIGWQNTPKRNFYQLIEKAKLSENSLKMTGQWVLIDNRNKPIRFYPWIAKDDFLVFLCQKFLGLNWLKKCRAMDRQQYQEDFLLEILKKNGFNSRYAISWREINEIIKPEAAALLSVAKEKIRLPKFIEWNFLGNLFYPAWGKTSTWEWFNDQLKTGECLAGGAGSLSSLGWDPPDHWSNILGFRFIIEL